MGNMYKLFESWRRHIREDVIEEDKVSVKKLKKQKPEFADVIDKFAEELENHSVLGALEMYKAPIEKYPNLSDAYKKKIGEDIIEVTKKFEKLVKTRKLDSWLKNEGYGKEYKDLLKIYKKFGGGKYSKFGYFLDDMQFYKTKKEKQKEKQKEIKKQTEKVYSDDRFLVIQPKSEAASCHYGQNTKWCISYTDPSTPNRWNEYVERGAKILFVFDKEPVSDEYEKVAIAYLQDRELIEIKDATNEEIVLDDLRGIYSEDLETIRTALEKKMGFKLNILEIPFKIGEYVKFTEKEIKIRMRDERKHAAGNKFLTKRADEYEQMLRDEKGKVLRFKMKYDEDEGEAILKALTIWENGEKSFVDIDELEKAED